MKALIFPSYNCNLKCTHCFNPDKFRFAGVGGLKEWQQAVINLAKLGASKLIIIGGEPMMIPYMPKLLSFALKLQLLKNGKLYNPYRFVNIQTNATLENSLLFETIKRDGLDKRKIGFNVSLEGSNPDENDKVRGNGSFEMALQTAIKWKTQGYNVTIRSTIFEWNDVVEIAKLAKYYELDFTAVRLLPSGRGEKIDVSNIPTEKTLYKIYSQLSELDENSQTSIVCEDNPYYLYNERLRTKYFEIYKKNGSICPAISFEELAVDPLGLVTVCHMALDSAKYPEWVVGNIFKDDWKTLKENWKKTVNNLKSKPLNTKCSKCKYSNICNGGCTFYSVNSNFRGDPYCPLPNIELRGMSD
ncbi:MAG: radical SAM protein [Sulfolobaceae archaeon]